jgi:hypothetical protein
MAESPMCQRLRQGRSWLQAQVQQALTRASIPLAPSTEHEPPMYWGTLPDTRETLYLRLDAEQEPRQIPFARSLILDCGAGMRRRHDYARSYITRSLRQMRILPP